MTKLVSGFKLFRRSFSYMGRDKKRYLLGVALASLELALLFATPYINKMLIDIVSGKSGGNMVLILALMFILFLLLVPPVIYGKYLQNTSAYKGEAELKKALFGHVLDMPYEDIARLKTGDYITRLTDDASRAAGVFRSYAINCLFRFAVVFSAALALLLVSDWRIAAAGMVYSVISLVLSILLNPYTKRLEREAKLEIVHSASFLIEAMRGLPIVRVFTLHEVLSEKYRRICGIIRSKRIKFRTVNGITYGIIDFFTFSAQAVGFIIGVLLSLNRVELGSAVFNATLMGLMADSMLRLSTFMLLIQPTMVAMERVYEVMDVPAEALKESGVKADLAAEDAIVLKNVGFSYDEGERKRILNHLNLRIRNGEHLAIVGGSGGGKSTLIKLIEGFHMPTEGEISYFGNAGLTIGDIRSLLSYIPQECSLFDGTIGENIAMGRPGASREDIEAAARLANIDAFIGSLPQKYDTQVGERGAQLSGGQKQRIAIARAVLKGAPVLLLDEATAALDSATEKEVQKCLDAVSGGLTTVTVAHRLSTVKNAHRILVMEAGEIVEEGSFEELLQKGGRFKDLYDSQLRRA